MYGFGRLSFLDEAAGAGAGVGLVRNFGGARVNLTRRFGMGRGVLSSSGWRWRKEPLGLGWAVSTESFSGVIREWPMDWGDSHGVASAMMESVDNSNLRREPPLRGAARYRGCATSDGSYDGSVGDSFRTGDCGRYC